MTEKVVAVIALGLAASGCGGSSDRSPAVEPSTRATATLPVVAEFDLAEPGRLAATFGSDVGRR